MNGANCIFSPRKEKRLSKGEPFFRDHFKID